MYNLNKKQKIMLVITLIIIIGCIFYYIYAKDEKTEINLENNLEIQNITEEQNKENFNNTIFVHVSGAVNKEGVVELEMGSRMSDAINKARWNYTRSIFKRYKFSL